MTDPTNGQTRTRAWKRLRKLLGIDPGTERRAILQAAADKIEWLRKKGQELKNLVEMIAGQRDAALAERDALKAEVERFRSAARLRPFREWDDDFGNVLWFVVPVNEPPFHVGTPHDSDWTFPPVPNHQIAWCELPELRLDRPDDAGGGA